MKKKLIVIAGPTAVGKTASSVELAKNINGEIISIDSMQLYKEMNIGTAKVTEEEMQGIKHYMVDEVNPDDEVNVVMFKDKVKAYIDEIHSKGKVPILVGGTGFYIQAIIYDIDFKNEEEGNQEIRDKYFELANEKGNEYVHSLLEDIDKESYDKLHPNNIRRVIRALEYYDIHNAPISEHNREQEESKESPYDLTFFVLTCKDRDLLYDRINMRVDIMFDMGLLKEVEKLNKKYNKNLNSMQGIGYKEVIDYIEGNVSYERMIEVLKQNTRKFAKRQLTWFRREKNVIWIEVDELEFKLDDIIAKMLQIYGGN
ncbi:MAG: tRNA (adenosine(37)-N6)-dimethylallyltransferase MiaA [Clostridia bacterium]|nr:tRNA (adenosine(37)-N6)-dimethylallyltransferase MiaA [Clostridia bacterium]